MSQYHPFKKEEKVMGKVIDYHCWNYREDIYLVDMTFDMYPNEIDIYSMVVPEEGEKREFWQFPFLNQFLSLDGTELVCSWCGKPATDMKPCRMVFFIYKCDGPDGKILQTPYGDFPLTDTEEAPERMKEIVEYFDVED